MAGETVETPRKKILLVEDEAIIAMQEAKLLRAHRYEVVTVHSGEAAVEQALTEADIDLILMDIDLGPGMEGTEAARRILKQRELPVVFLTSHAERETVEQVKHITRYGYVLKSSGEFVLLEAINMAFELFEAHMRSKAKERELEEANRLKRLLLDSTSEMFAIYDTDLVIQWANKTAADSVGRSPDELIGKHCYEIWFERDAPCMECPLVRVLETGEPQEEEQRTPDGREWLLRGYPVYDEGRMSGLVEFGQEISQRRRAERWMLRSEERYRLLYNTISDAVVMVNQNRVITHCNPAFTEMFGYTLDEVQGKRTSFLYADASEYEKLGAAMQQRAGESSFRTILRYRRKSGELFSAEKNLHFLRNSEGELTGFIGVLRELTDLKYAEERVKASRKAYAELFEYTPVILWEEDFSGIKEYLDSLRARGVRNLEEYFTQHPEEISTCVSRIRVTDINRETMKLLGVTDKSEVLGNLQKTFTDASLDMLRKELLAIWNRETIVEDTGRIRTPEGEEREVILRWQILPSHTEDLSKILISFIDITRRVQAERENRELIEEKKMLLREVHHRIKNDMNSIGALLSLQSASLESREAAEALEEAQHRISLMSSVYDTLHRTQEYRFLRTGEVLEQVIDAIRESYEGYSHITLETRIADLEIPAKQAFPIGIILNELIANAYKYAFPRHTTGLIRIELAPRGSSRIDIRAEDNGVPFPEAVTRGEGYGFGLTLVDAFSQQYAGEVRIQNGTEMKRVLVTLTLSSAE